MTLGQMGCFATPEQLWDIAVEDLGEVSDCDVLVAVLVDPYDYKGYLGGDRGSSCYGHTGIRGG